jgi:hypothetical protein
MPVQIVIGLVVGGGDLASCAFHQLYHLLDGLSLLCIFGFCFSFGPGFCFCFRYESPVGKEGVCKVKQVLETEAHSWLLVRMLVEKVGVECRAVLGMKALPE